MAITGQYREEALRLREEVKKKFNTQVALCKAIGTSDATYLSAYVSGKTESATSSAKDSKPSASTSGMCSMANADSHPSQPDPIPKSWPNCTNAPTNSVLCRTPSSISRKNSSTSTECSKTSPAHSIQHQLQHPPDNAG